MFLTHLDDQGRAQMVDISEKTPSRRVAEASGRVRMSAATLQVLEEGAPKGDVLAAARIAAIQGAKRTSELIPLCHTIALDAVSVHFEPWDEGVAIRARVVCREATGVEMEALTAVSIAALTLYDMLKAVDKGMAIEAIQLERKEGGRSGTWER